jgi:hypothetical protein
LSAVSVEVPAPDAVRRRISFEVDAEPPVEAVSEPVRDTILRGVAVWSDAPDPVAARETIRTWVEVSVPVAVPVAVRARTS